MEPFISLTDSSNVQIYAIGTESHCSIVIEELYHNPLMNTLRKMRISYPSADMILILQLSVKEISDIQGTEKLLIDPINLATKFCFAVKTWSTIALESCLTSLNS